MLVNRQCYYSQLYAVRAPQNLPRVANFYRLAYNHFALLSSTNFFHEIGFSSSIPKLSLKSAPA